MATQKPTKRKPFKPDYSKPIKLDLGCGKNKKGPDYIGLDELDFEGVDIVINVGKDKWPFKDGSVDEVHASHFVEHLYPEERIHFVNELDRVLVKPEYNNASAIIKGFATIIVPHWASQRAYGDLTHKWPAVSEFWFYYLYKDWRAVNAPHNQTYTCNLACTWGYNMHQELVGRNVEFQTNAMKWHKEACSDIICTMTKKQSL